MFYGVKQQSKQSALGGENFWQSSMQGVCGKKYKQKDKIVRPSVD
jgi:hypothetical protein